MEPYNIRECELCPDKHVSYACKSHMSLHFDESHPPQANPISSHRWLDVSALRKAKEGLRVTPPATDRRPDSKPSYYPPSEAHNATTKGHRSDHPKPSEESYSTRSRAVEIIDLSGSDPVKRGRTPLDRSSDATKPKAFRAGNGPLTIGHVGGRGGRGNPKDRRKERGQTKQGCQARPKVASVAKAVCFYSPHENDVASTGGGAHYVAPPVVRHTYHQDRPRTYSEAAGGQPKGPAPLGEATRNTPHTQP